MKYIYLDQMMWINFAKAAVGRADGKQFLPVLEKAKEAVARQEAVFPLSSAHLRETASSPRSDQRTKLAELMTELSAGGIVLKAGRRLITEQLRVAVGRLFYPDLNVPEPDLFGRGLVDAFGLEIIKEAGVTDQQIEVSEFMLRMPEAWKNLLSYSYEAERKAGVTKNRETAEEFALREQEQRRNDENESFDFKRRKYAARQLLTFSNELLEALESVGKSWKDFKQMNTDEAMEFNRNTPQLHVELELTVQRDLQKNRQVDRNDASDIVFLSFAIPACDVVLTERFWVDLAKRSKLDEKYDTILLSNLSDLEEHLS